MPSVVVDTDVVSYVFKKDTRAPLYHQHLIGNSLILSFMTLAELRQWALRRRWGQASRDRLDPHLRAYHIYYADKTCAQFGPRLAIAPAGVAAPLKLPMPGLPQRRGLSTCRL